MRIYEIAKETGVSSADVLKAAKAAGVAASNAISDVNGDEVGKLREALKGADAAAAAAKRQQKLSKAAELNAQFFAEQKAKLEEHLKIAKEAAEGKKSKSKVEVEQRKDSNSAVRLPTTTTAFFSRANMKPILLAFLVAFFNQMSGCNAINYFAVRIFGMAGLGRDAQFLSSFGLGILNFASTFAGLWLIDRIGRKTLLVIGGIGYIVSLFAGAFFFNVGNGPLAAVTIFLFMASHAVGQGTVIWVLISEVFPQKFRAQGQALGASTHWVFAALVALFFPIAAGAFPAWVIFGFFGVMMVFHLLWVIFVVPETKGTDLR